jgi:alkanesulfonate monooxygenase SsuD/methylene tetrahydromethanopterin reductase-like flavin-dependent oxidoreductase (luciferase family)
MTGALADGWVPSLGRLDLDQAVAMRAAVRASAEAAGRDPDQITCAANLIVEFTPDRTAASQDGQLRDSQLRDSQLRDSQLRGDSKTVAERLIGIGRAGFTFFNVALADADARRRFAAEVMPLVRAELARARP